MTKPQTEELHAEVGTVTSWRDDTSTLIAELALQFASEAPDGTVQEPEHAASLAGQEVALRLVGNEDRQVRHGRVTSVAVKVQKDGPPIATAKVSSSGALSSWAGRAVTICRLQMELGPVAEAGAR